MAKRKVVSLIRVSTDKQAAHDKSGLEVQKKDIIFTCKHFDLVDIHQITLEGVSGVDVGKTREYRELKAMIERSDIAGLVIPSMSRLTRDANFGKLDDLLKPLYALLPDSKFSAKRLFVRKSELDVNKPSDCDIVYQQARSAQDERELISERTGSAKDEKRADPMANIDKLPWGIDHNRIDPKINHGPFAYHPFAKHLVNKAYTRVLAGDSLHSIAVWMDGEMRSPECGKWQRRVRAEFSQQSLRDMLTSTLWKGIKSKQKSRTAERWDEKRNTKRKTKRQLLPADQQIFCDAFGLRESPCVTDEIWEAVRGKLSQNSNEHTKKKSLADNFLARPLGRCSCGRKLFAIEKKGYAYYHCSWHVTRKGEPCKLPYGINARLMEKALIETCMALLTDELFVAARISESMSTENLEGKKQTAERLEKEIDAGLKKKERIADSLEDAEPEDLAMWKGRLKAQNEVIASAREKLRVVRLELADVVSPAHVAKEAARVTMDFAHFDKKATIEQKAILGRYVESITVGREEEIDLDLTKGSGEPVHYINWMEENPSPMAYMQGRRFSFTFKLKWTAIDVVDSTVPKSNGPST